MVRNDATDRGQLPLSVMVVEGSYGTWLWLYTVDSRSTSQHNCPSLSTLMSPAGRNALHMDDPMISSECARRLPVAEALDTCTHVMRQVMAMLRRYCPVSIFFHPVLRLTLYRDDKSDEKE
jgi:hypothetical protein